MAEKVTIIIPVFNCPYVDQAIESALSQTYENTEIIVVNDGSTEYEQQLTPYLNEVTYIKKGNGGTATALNLGIERATGSYFTWLSSDDLYDRDKVSKQYSFMKRHGSSISFASYFHINSQNQVTHGPIRNIFPTKKKFYERLLRGCPINGCTVMMKMDLFKEVGIFDRSLPFTHDYDMWLRILPKYDFHYLDEPIVLHRVHDNMGTKHFEDRIKREIRFVQNKHRSILEQLIYKEENTTI
jgi:glycosyltransferase involved in cell wall biosynthesis